MKLTISAKHALSAQELDFCKRYAAGLNPSEAYRRAFAKLLKEEAEKKGLDAGVSTKEVSRRSQTLLKQEYIVRYLGEIGHPAGERARAVLHEQALFGEDIHARRAAEKILDDEDKLGFRDAVERFLEIMVEIGAEIEVPLPGRFQRRIQTVCPGCEESIDLDIDEPLSAKVPAEAMFKKKDDSDADV